MSLVGPEGLVLQVFKRPSHEGVGGCWRAETLPLLPPLYTSCLPTPCPADKAPCSQWGSGQGPGRCPWTQTLAVGGVSSRSHPSDEKEFSFPRNISAGSLGSLLVHHHSANHVAEGAEPTVTDPLIGSSVSEHETRVDMMEKEVRSSGGRGRALSAAPAAPGPSGWGTVEGPPRAGGGGAPATGPTAGGNSGALARPGPAHFFCGRPRAQSVGERQLSGRSEISPTSPSPILAVACRGRSRPRPSREASSAPSPSTS